MPKLGNLHQKKFYTIGPCFQLNQGILTEEEGSVQLTPGYKLVQISYFNTKSTFMLIYTKSYLIEEVNCINKASLSVRVPWLNFLSTSG